MQEVPRIILRSQLVPQLRIPHRPIEIHHHIEMSRRANPRIHRLPRLLSNRITARLNRAVRGVERRDRLAEQRDSRRVGPGDHLLEDEDDLLADESLRDGVVARGADGVHALEDHRVSDARVGGDVAGEARVCVGTVTVEEEAFAAGSDVAVGDGADGWRGGRLHSIEEEVRPAVVRVGVAAAAFGDAVADDHEGGLRFGDPGFYGGEEVPVCHRLGVWTCDVGGGDLVAERVEDVGSTARVAGNLGGSLVVGEVHASADDVVGGYREVEWIRNDLRAIWDVDGSVAGECDGLEGGGLD